MTSSELLTDLVVRLSESFVHLEKELSQLQIGRASPNLVESVMVDCYGTKQSIRNIASISVPDSSSLQIQPWDKANLAPIESALGSSSLNLPVKNDGLVIWIRIPSPTEERRRDLIKIVSQKVEEAKIRVRNVRHDCLSGLKILKENSEVSEDSFHQSEKLVQAKVDELNKKMEEAGKKKEEEIMKV